MGNMGLPPEMVSMLAKLLSESEGAGPTFGSPIPPEPDGKKHFIPADIKDKYAPSLASLSASDKHLLMLDENGEQLPEGTEYQTFEEAGLDEDGNPLPEGKVEVSQEDDRAPSEYTLEEGEGMSVPPEQLAQEADAAPGGLNVTGEPEVVGDTDTEFGGGLDLSTPPGKFNLDIGEGELESGGPSKFNLDIGEGEVGPASPGPQASSAGDVPMAQAGGPLTDPQLVIQKIIELLTGNAGGEEEGGSSLAGLLSKKMGGRQV